jgi:hypothetical protein
VTHNAKVKGDDIAVWGYLKIALVHVCVEKAIAKCVVQKKLEYTCAKLVTIVPKRIYSRIVAQRDALGPAHGHYPTTGVLPDDFGQCKSCVIFGVCGKFACRGALKSEVKLAFDDTLKVLDYIAWL